MGSSIDYWDGAANRHYLTFAMAHGPTLRRLYGQDQMRVIADVLLRHKNIWARECRCLEREGHKPDDLGKALWAAEMQRGLESIHARFVPHHNQGKDMATEIGDAL